MNFTHAHCTVDDFAAGLELLRDAALWLRRKGIDSWQNWLDPEPEHVAWVRSGFERGEFRFALDGGEIVGMYRLQTEDEDFWGKRPEPSGYIHSFTTKRTLSGRGIGRMILDDVSGVLLDRGIGLLRLDCSPLVEGLCRFYEGYGFIRVGLATAHAFEAALYEKRLSRLSP